MCVFWLKIFFFLEGWWGVDCVLFWSSLRAICVSYLCGKRGKLQIVKKKDSGGEQMPGVLTQVMQLLEIVS